MSRKATVYCADFETTVFENQQYTEVWAAALVALYTEKVHIDNSIDGFMERLKMLNHNAIIYFHNLKFDGEFILSHLLQNSDYYTQAIRKNGNVEDWKKPRELTSGEYTCSISDKGQWYNITISFGSHIIEIRDSLKLLPFSVAEISKAFNCTREKLEIEYEGVRHAGGVITTREKMYISNDVLIPKEALEKMLEQGHTAPTIGSCCMREFKAIIGKYEWNTEYPNLQEVPLAERFGALNADEYIRKAYRGGWCYVTPEKACVQYNQGVTADVNSLYPSVMHSDSGNEYPIGLPAFWQGNYIPDEATNPHRYYYVRIKCRFQIKDGYLPFIQIKNTFRYAGNESLTTSDYYDEKTGRHSRYYRDRYGNICDTYVILTLTCTDYKRILKHYNVYDLQILDGCYFIARSGMFDEYINKYARIKQTSKGALRTIAKLFLNNLYGKLASSDDSSFKVPYLLDGVVKYRAVEAHEKDIGYIAIGAAITSYAREFTISHAQANYKHFIYADTDSIHCHCNTDALVGLRIHPTAFNAWKIESSWDFGWFVRQKTYIEHITTEDEEAIDIPYYLVKCAGMPQRCKNLFLQNVMGEVYTGENEEVKEFMSTRLDITDFNVGLRVPLKLRPVRIKGGIVLKETMYQIRK